MTKRDMVIALVDFYFLCVCMGINENNQETYLSCTMKLTKILRLPEVKLCISENEYIFITKALNYVLMGV